MDPRSASTTAIVPSAKQPIAIYGYPFEVIESRESASAVLADQIKSLDWRARTATKQGKISPAALAEVRAKIKARLQI